MPDVDEHRLMEIARQTAAVYRAALTAAGASETMSAAMSASALYDLQRSLKEWFNADG